jgi:hypothetical protein
LHVVAVDAFYQAQVACAKLNAACPDGNYLSLKGRDTNKAWKDLKLKAPKAVRRADCSGKSNITLLSLMCN